MVQKINLIEFLKAQTFNSLFLKIDIEGGELNLIRSISKILKKTDRWVILFELNEIFNSRDDFLRDVGGSIIYDFGSDIMIENAGPK